MINYAPILNPIRIVVFNFLDINGGKHDAKGFVCRKLRYLSSCIFCISFWVTLMLSWQNIFYVPVLATIINFAFHKSFFK